MAGVVIGGLINAVTPLVISAARNYSIKYGPTKAQEGVDETERFTTEAHQERDFVRDKAQRERNPLTEEEYAKAIADARKLDGPETDLMEFSDDEAQDLIHWTCNDFARETPVEPRAIRLCYQTIRMSRDLLGTEAFSSPAPFFAHWCVEVSLP